ncbi:hypothetical protein KR032_002490 [Drosophila birchii]|nr:hypothetical protein KR032_002490 [Drosophila birchii]
MPSPAINKTGRSVANTLQLLAIVLSCCCLLVNGQQQQQQQQHLKYQQLQYQMQQQYEYQQQQHYQQQFQQQQQKQQQQQQQLTPTAALAQQQQQHEEQIDLLSTQPTQLLQTGVSLIVDDGKGSGDGSGSGTNRRRIAQLGARKRKRRPQLPLATMGANEEDSDSIANSGSGSGSGSAYWRGHVEDDADALRRRKQPLVREPMAALERDREKQRQRVAEPTDATIQASSSKAYRRPYGQAKKEPTPSVLPESALPVATKTSVDLKNILKNSGGLSLSEILQQKNLSLDDLLKGKQNALLALQTTAVAPAASTYSSPAETSSSSIGYRKSPIQLNKQGVRRLPAAYTTASSTSSGIAEEPEAAKNKGSKYPGALQRLKLFGSSSRESSTTRRILGGIATSPTMATSISSSSTTTTTRVPLYKKRQHLRSTLKPPGLFKPIMSTPTTTTAAASTTQEAETSTVYTTTTAASSQEQGREEENEHELDEKESAQESEQLEQDHEQEQEPEQAEEGNSQQEPDEEPEEQPNSGESSPPTEAASVPSPSLPPGSNPRYRLRNSSIKEQNQKRLKDNFIGHYDRNAVDSAEELDQPERGPISTAAAPAGREPPVNRSSEEINEGDDELENFFDEVESHTHHTRVPAPPAPAAAPAPSPSAIAPAPAPSSPSAAAPSPSAFPMPGKPPQLNIIDDVDDRTDLLELIEDRRSGNRLFKVLEQRNMTLEELIEHRKRGSSQLHLSTIVSGGDEHSRLYPGQKVLLQDNMDIVTAFENFPHFNLMDLKSVKPDEIKTDSQGSSYFTSIIDIEPNDEVVKPSTGNRGPAYAPASSSSSATIGVGTGTISINQRGEKSLGFFPSWKTLALASLATATEERNPYFLPPPRLLLDGTSSSNSQESSSSDSNPEPEASIDIDLGVSPYGGSNSSSMVDNSLLPVNNDVIDEIENEVARAHDLLDLELSGPGFHRSPAAAAATSAVSQQHLSSLYASMPSGVRSAIVASSAIVITALATFLVVFVVCRWKQQRRRKSSYLRTYNAMKSKLPQMVQPSRRSSMRQHMEELVIGSNSGSSPGIASISTSVACCTPVHQLQQRQSSLLFGRDGTATLSTTTATSLTTNTNSASAGTTSGATAAAAAAAAASASLEIQQLSGGGRGLRSAHQKLNTMDPNSPEVQEYLFDTLRKSFDN